MTAALKPNLFILIFQHPQEPKEPLGSVPTILKTLQNCEVRVGLSVSNLKAILEKTSFSKPVDPKRWAVLYFGSGIKGLPEDQKNGLFEVAKNGSYKKTLSPKDQKELDGVIILDGTWSQAKALWWRNAWLLKLRRILLLPEKPSLYGKLRKEPKRETVSTLEAIAETLEHLGESPQISKQLLENFEAHLAGFRNKKTALNVTSSST